MVDFVCSKKYIKNSGGFAGILILLGVVFVLFLFIDLMIINYKLFLEKKVVMPSFVSVGDDAGEKVQTPGNLSVTSTDSGSCLKDCQDLIDFKIENLKEELMRVIQANSPKVSSLNQTQSSTTTSFSAKELFVTFGANGSTQSTSWTDVAGTEASFDTGNYPGVKEFYFQANLRSDAPDRAVYARIYDVNHGVGIQESEINFTGLTSTFVESGKLTFLSGKLKLRVQVKSLNGNLAVVDSSRIRIVF